MLIAFCLLFFVPNLAQAENLPPQILITELQTATTTSSDQEFVEIYNDSDAAVNLADYNLEYFSATSTKTTPTWFVNLDGTLEPDSYYFVARQGYLADTKNLEFTSALADTGGYVRISQVSTGDIIDALGWGGSTRFEGHVAPAPAKSKSLVRSMQKDLYIDSDENLSDFSVLDTPNPATVNYVYVPEPEILSPPDPTPVLDVGTDPAPDPTPDPALAPAEIPPVVTPEYLEPYITELLPNPAPPQTDADDEYIELYNPNDIAIDLSGYKIQSGNTYSYSYVISDLVISAKSYVVIYSKDSGLTLSNTSSKAHLINKSGQVVSETDQYSDVPEGQSWQFYIGVWQWSITGSPGASNVQTFPTSLSTIKAASPAKPKSTKTAKAAAAKTTKAKLASAKTTTPKKTTKKTETGPSNNFQEPTLPRTIHPLMLGGAGLLALSYGAYEYRFELSNFLRQLRGNRIFGGGAS